MGFNVFNIKLQYGMSLQVIALPILLVRSKVSRDDVLLSVCHKLHTHACVFNELHSAAHTEPLIFVSCNPS